MKADLRGMILAGALALAALAGSSVAQQAGEPPLLPGEVYIAGPNNCGLVVTQADVDTLGGKDALLKAVVKEGTLNAPCEEGLLHGAYKGTRFHHGRALLFIRSFNDFEMYTTKPGINQPGEEAVQFHRLGSGLTPRWPDLAEEGQIKSSVTIRRGGSTTNIYARRLNCITVKVAIRGCNRDKPATWFGLYVVEVANTPTSAPGEPPKPRESTVFPCPDYHKSASCEGLWREQIARYQPQIDEIMARVKLAEAEKIRQLDDLNGANNPIRKAQIQAERQLAAQQKADEEAQLAAERAADARRAQEEAAAKKARAAAQAAADQARRVQIQADLAAAQAKADAAFRQKVAAGNPGSLYALADELAEAGDTAKAKEVLRSLISRFPNHALAATAAQRLTTLGSTSSLSGGGGVSPASTTRSSAAPRYSSVCVRNLQKAEAVLTKANARHSAATYDRWLINLNDIVARLYQPCISYDATAARDYKRAVDEAAKIRQYCAGPHPEWTCYEWGGSGSGDMNRNWFNIWNGEIQKAFANPDYSADMGTAAGPGGTVVGGSGQTAAAPASTGNPQAHEQCRAEMERLGDVMNRQRQRIPAGQTVPLLELIMWHADAAAKAIERMCPGSAPYAIDKASFRKTYSDSERTCNQLANRTCAARAPD